MCVSGEEKKKEIMIWSEFISPTAPAELGYTRRQE